MPFELRKRYPGFTALLTRGQRLVQVEERLQPVILVDNLTTGQQASAGGNPPAPAQPPSDADCSPGTTPATPPGVDYQTMYYIKSSVVQASYTRTVVAPQGVQQTWHEAGIHFDTADIGSTFRCTLATNPVGPRSASLGSANYQIFRKDFNPTANQRQIALVQFGVTGKSGARESHPLGSEQTLSTFYDLDNTSISQSIIYTVGYPLILQPGGVLTFTVAAVGIFNLSSAIFHGVFSVKYV